MFPSPARRGDRDGYPYVVGSDERRRYPRQIFGASYRRFARIDRMVEHTAIETHHLTLLPERLFAPRNLEG